MILSITIFFLMFSAPLSNTTNSGCQTPVQIITKFERIGDVIIGGMVPIHYSKTYLVMTFQESPQTDSCELFDNIYYRIALSIVFAIEEINSNHSFLPNTTLGFSIYDSCDSVLMSLLRAMHLLTGQEEPVPNFRCKIHPPLAALIGEDKSSLSIPLARLLGVYRFPQLLHYIKHVRFTKNNGEEVFYDSAGNAPGIYEIMNWQITQGETLQFVKVGSFDFTATVGQVLIINESAILWNGAKRKVPLSVCSNSCPPGYRKAIRPGKPLCCFDCILCDEGEISNQTDMTDCLKCLDHYWPNEQKNKCIKKSTEFLSYQEPLGAALGVTAVTIAVVPAIILLIFIMYRNTPIVKANNRELSYVLLIALLFSVFCALVFIGQPMNVTCIIRQIAFGIVFALSVSCILAKTIMVVLAFRATKPNSSMKRWIGPQLGNSIVVSSTSVQLILCTVWLCLSPPFVERNTSYKLGTIIIQCNEGSTTAFWCMLGYMGLMAIVSFVVAFLSRKLPDSFNEANYITFSMLVFVTVWLSFIPAYLSTKGKYMVAVEVFSILSSSAGLISCIFFPKCYIILLRPDLNSKEFLMGRGASRTNKFK
ncbi:vomeronasal type-2 receptor 26-like [Ascaphus truei]|uniref:vomeronasal type-2 receptor 26-like n=1 Tax=Ascaphus truei TaxID=8439 RepID=UPI003F5A6E0D